MKVKALKTGYYNHKRQKPGSIFELEPYEVVDEKGKEKIVSVEEQFSPRWMVKVVTKKFIEVDEEVHDDGEPEAQEGKKGKGKKKSTGDEEVI